MNEEEGFELEQSLLAEATGTKESKEKEIREAVIAAFKTESTRLFHVSEFESGTLTVEIKLLTVVDVQRLDDVVAKFDLLWFVVKSFKEQNTVYLCIFPKRPFR